MKTGQTTMPPTFQVHKPSMITGGALIGVGGLIALSGVIISGTALAAAGRQWIRNQEVPPSEVLKHTWDQTKAAAAAGSAAWQQHNGIHRAHA